LNLCYMFLVPAKDISDLLRKEEFRGGYQVPHVSTDEDKYLDYLIQNRMLLRNNTFTPSSKSSTVFRQEDNKKFGQYSWTPDFKYANHEFQIIKKMEKTDRKICFKLQTPPETPKYSLIIKKNENDNKDSRIKPSKPKKMKRKPCWKIYFQAI